MTRENLQPNYNESENEEDSEEQRTLFCANLDERVTEELLYEVFLQAGPIESARIPKDHNGKQRTFGFITYVHKLTLPYAMQLYQGLSLYRKSLAIKYQGSAQTTPIRNFHNSSASSNNRSGYDNSALRGGNYTPFRDTPPQNPFRSNYSTPSAADYQENISKHASGSRRLHANSSPYQRKSGNGEHRDRDQDRDHNRRRHYNNGSNRHSDQRSGGKHRR